MLGVTAIAGCSRKTPAPPTPNANAALSELADQYFEQVYFHYSPTTATLLGLHQYDTQLEDYSPR